MDRPHEAHTTNAPRTLPLLALGIALLAAATGPAAALHAAPIAVSVGDAVRISADPPLHTLDRALGDAAGTPPPARGAPETARDAAAAPEPASSASAESAAPPLVLTLPAQAWWALGALALAAALLSALLVGILLRRRGRAAGERRSVETLRRDLELSRLCAEAARMRTARMLDANAALRAELAALKAAQPRASPA